MESQTKLDPDWWRGAVIYQIYPRSFQDAGDDGVGDLTGIRRRLQYIADLGADAIWISPFFKSPMKDFGYDVSDYRDIDPLFGDLAEFDALLDAAHTLGIRVMIDLVISHTSDQHDWFGESRSSRNNNRHDWYIWADAKPDGTPPNNWLSIFGGCAWTWDTTRQQYYMHNFLSSQPDLNFHNPDVQQAVLDVARFWLDRGVDGFRLDTINFYFCDKTLRDNPPLAEAQRNADIAPAVNPYNHQSHQFDKSQPENLVFLEKFRALMDQYPAVATVGEVGDAEKGMQLLADYTRGKQRVHMCYTFDFLSPQLPTPEHIKNTLQQFLALGDDSWICWAFSNHDVERHASRWHTANLPALEHLKVLASLLMSLRGTVCLYQGEELGLPEGDVPFEALQDPYGIKFWPKYKGRDGCRTPMVWNAGDTNAGFSTAKPWLPVAREHLALAVDQQLPDPASLLNHYRRFISFRREHTPLLKGSIESLDIRNGALCFTRRHHNQAIFCAFNPGAETIRLQLDDELQLEALVGHGFDSKLEHRQLTLPACSAAYLRAG